MNYEQYKVRTKPQLFTMTLSTQRTLLETLRHCNRITSIQLTRSLPSSNRLTSLRNIWINHNTLSFWRSHTLLLAFSYLRKKIWILNSFFQCSLPRMTQEKGIVLNEWTLSLVNHRLKLIKKTNHISSRARQCQNMKFCGR